MIMIQIRKARRRIPTLESRSYVRIVPDKVALERIFSPRFSFPGSLDVMIPLLLLADLMTTHHHQVCAKVITRRYISSVSSF